MSETAEKSVQQPSFQKELQGFLSGSNRDWEEAFSGLGERDTSDPRLDDTRTSMLEKFTREFLDNFAAHPEFRAALETAKTCFPSRSQSRQWQLLIDDPLIRIGLLTVFRFNRIPLHDHPGSYGAQLVLSGAVNIRQFDHEVRPGIGKGLAQLTQIADLDLAAGDHASFTPTRGNIHGVAATSPRCVLLNAILYPYCEQERGWYFPIEGFPQPGTTLLTNKISKYNSRSDFVNKHQ